MESVLRSAPTSNNLLFFILMKYWLWGAKISSFTFVLFHSSCCFKYCTAVQTSVGYTGLHCQLWAVRFSSQGCDSTGGPLATVAEWLLCCGLMRTSGELQVVCWRCLCHQFLPVRTAYLKRILNAPLRYRSNNFNFFIHNTITIHHRILSVVYFLK